MTPERWAKIEELFHLAAECDPDQQLRLLDAACSDDEELRREVEGLLASEKSAREAMHAAVNHGLEAATYPLVGETVSHYRILDGLGGGGMGLVYRAEDLKLGRQVALKFLPEESTKDPAALGRFEREARSASALEQPNICPIYEFGEHEGQPFLVMQLLEGRTVRDLIACTAHGKAPVAIDKLLDLAVQIATGLEAAHGHGIIHRDIKPANIFVTKEGQVKILDFGLAKLAQASEELEIADPAGSEKDPSRHTSPSITPDPWLSRTGVAMGTAGYMSPEQARGEKLDARTDLFSFGLVMYEMATGQRAFQGDTGPLLHDAILHQVPTPARRLNPKIPAKLERIIHKALEKDREARYQSIADARVDLESLKLDLQPRSRTLFKLAAACGTLAFLLGTAFVWYEKRQPPRLPDLKLRQLTINAPENAVKSGALSPDGKFLAYVDARGMHIKRLETGETRNVVQPEQLQHESVTWEIPSMAWLPGSASFIANTHPAGEEQGNWSSQTSTIWNISVTGAAPRKLRENAMAWSVSPTGSWMAFGANKGLLGEREIWLMEPGGNQAHKLADTDENSAIGGALWFANGKRIFYARSDKTGDTFLSSGLTGDNPVTLLSAAQTKDIIDVVLTPNNRFIYALKETQQTGATCDFWVMRLDPNTGAPLERATRLTNGAGFCATNPSVTADGRRLAFLQSSAGHDTSYVTDLEAGGTRLTNQRHFTLEEADYAITDWTADSESVIVAHNFSDRRYEVYKQSLNSETLELLSAPAPGLIEFALASPDGKWVIASVYNLSFPQYDPSATQPLLRIPLSGGPPQLTFSIRANSPISCARAPSNLCVVGERSEDRKQMIVTSFDPVRGRGQELARFEVDPNLDQNFNNLLCAISPDGTRLASARWPDGPIEIRSLRGQPTKFIRAPELDKLWGLNWSADGKGLYLAKRIKDGTYLLYTNMQGQVKILWKTNAPKAGGIPSPDGRHLAVLDWQQSANMWLMENF